MSDEWLEQLRGLHEADKAKREAAVEPEQPQDRQSQAAKILQQSKAHTLLRQVQKVLLGGGGQLDVFESTTQYDRGLALVWQGPISAARKPKPNDPDEYHYILIGVRDGRLWVNGKALPSATVEALKAALLAASKHPEHGHRSK